MQAIIRHKVAVHSQTNDALLYYRNAEERLEIKDDGEELGKLVLGILAGNTKSVEVSIKS